jgi:hypothetical protein
MRILGEQGAHCAEGWHESANEPTQRAWDIVWPLGAGPGPPPLPGGDLERCPGWTRVPSPTRTCGRRSSRTADSSCPGSRRPDDHGEQHPRRAGAGGAPPRYPPRRPVQLRRRMRHGRGLKVEGGGRDAWQLSITTYPTPPGAQRGRVGVAAEDGRCADRAVPGHPHDFLGVRLSYA